PNTNQKKSERYPAKLSLVRCLDQKNEVGSGLSFAWALAPHYHIDRVGDSLPCFRYESSIPVSVPDLPASLNPILSRNRSKLSLPRMANFQLVIVFRRTPALVSKYNFESMPISLSIALMSSRSDLFVFETNTARPLMYPGLWCARVLRVP